MHVDSELGPVACREVLVAVVRDRLVVDARIPRCRGIGVNGERRRLLPVRGQEHAVSLPRRNALEQHAPETVSRLGSECLSSGCDEGRLSRRGQTGDVYLLGTADGVKAGRCRGGGCRRQQADNEKSTDRDYNCARCAPNAKHVLPWGPRDMIIGPLYPLGHVLNPAKTCRHGHREYTPCPMGGAGPVAPSRQECVPSSFLERTEDQPARSRSRRLFGRCPLGERPEPLPPDPGHVGDRVSRLPRCRMGDHWRSPVFGEGTGGWHRA